MSERREPYYITHETPHPLPEMVNQIMPREFAKLFYRLTEARRQGAAGAWVDLDAMTVSVSPRNELLTCD